MRSLAHAPLVAVTALMVLACTQHERPEPDATPPVAKTTPPVEDAPDQAAPDEVVADPIEPEPLPPSERFGQNGRKLNPEIAGVGTEALEAAFPERAGGLERVDLGSSAAGTAGMWADSARATYGEEEREISIHVTDMIRVSECRVGTWDEYLDGLAAGEKTDPPQEAVAIGKRRGSYVELEMEGAGAVHSLSLRLGDRCNMELTGEVEKATLIAVADDLALDSLEASCAKRDRGGFGLGL